MSLKSSILQKIKKDKNLQRALEDFHNRSFYTIQEWIKHDNPMLSNYDSLEIISRHLELPIDELIDKNVKSTSL